ncbi:MAG TPA: ABC transporter permease subunit, partial [Ottowia sp.]|nr:ABC transporter permease subunit [Ottowia sp.]
HALPLSLPSAFVRAALDAPGIVLIVAGLGFLGVGLPPPQPEWGAMVAEGRALVFEAWWVSTLPGVMILWLSLGFNFVGDAMRDVVDPGVK